MSSFIISQLSCGNPITSSLIMNPVAIYHSCLKVFTFEYFLSMIKWRFWEGHRKVVPSLTTAISFCHCRNTINSHTIDASLSKLSISVVSGYPNLNSATMNH